MRRLLSQPVLFISATFLVLAQMGCEVKETVVTQTTDSAANAYLIEQKVEVQLGRINQGLQTGDLEPAMALGLTENDQMVKNLSLKFRAANQTHDLTTDQVAFLGSLLRGNSGAIDDALQRRDAWVQAFDGNGSYNYALHEDRLLFISVLQANLKAQDDTATGAIQAQSLTLDQAQEARGRIQAVRNVEIEDFHQNGELDLSSDQILELQQMAEDNAHFIRFLAQGSGAGTFAQDYASPSGSYPTQAFANIDSPTNGTVIGNGSSPIPSSSANYWNGRPTKATAMAPLAHPTPVPPPPTATFTPVPPAPTETFTPVPPAPAAQPSVNYLVPDPLKARDKQLDQLMDAAKKQGMGNPNQLAVASQIRKAFHKAMKADLQANQQKGLTQEQMDQLSRMLDDFAKAVSGLESPTPTVPSK